MLFLVNLPIYEGLRIRDDSIYKSDWLGQESQNWKLGKTIRQTSHKSECEDNNKELFYMQWRLTERLISRY
jgi:hypothetical protein